MPTLVQTSDGGVRETLSTATRNGVNYTVRRYRPRVEGLFARIERWQNQKTGDTFWKTVSKDNITSLFGLDSNGRITHPDNDSHVFKWLLERSYDDKGNVIVYEYKPETRDNVPLSIPESNHDPRANRYLKRICYGAAAPYYPDDTAPTPVPLPNNWFFQVILDYGEHDTTVPRPDEDHPWPVRQDAFSNYRSTFEVRSYRLCRRVLMFRQFAELGTTPCLVRSTNLTYKERPLASYLFSVQLVGYIRNQDDQSYFIKDPKTNEVLSPKLMPSVDMTYTEALVDQTVRDADPTALENLPYGVDGGHFQWVDLDSEGSPGVLAEYASLWLYKRNASNVPRDDAGSIVTDDDSTGSIRAYFEPVEEVATLPSLAQPIGGRQHFMDLDGEGRQFLVQFNRPVPGYFKRNDAGQWQSFVPFELCPNVDWGDPNLRTIDLDGDGFPDILITGQDTLVWYPSLAKRGFGEAQTMPKRFDENQGPAVVFADSTESIFLADFSGDGLTDIARIRNGEVCYWPNLGFGRFGAKITLDNSPNFDSPDQFDQKRIRLADIDGSGTTDIVYLGRDTIRLYFNQSGNSFSGPEELTQFPQVDNLDSVTAVDLLGNGTACLVWSSPLPGDSSRPLRYIDLMGGQKPHLLVSVVNNIGAETKVQYAASTKFYLLDRAAGTPWITRLAFPVHVVERVETFDYVSHHKFVSLYKYHHGYFDGVEREFRGFGMVEQLDTESFSKYSGGGLFTEPPETAGEDFYLPPVVTKTWVHTGAYVGEDKISRHFQEEYYQGDSAAVLLPDSALPDGLTADETREACRALKGKTLREEIYALDGSPQSVHPYTVTEHTYRVRLEQPMATNLHAVFYTHESESLAYHYERNPADPRIGHQLTLDVDEFGNVLKTASVGYPRRPSADIEPEQEKILITYTENDVINRPGELTWYRIGLPAETRTYELTGVSLTNGTVPFTLNQLLSWIAGATEIQDETIWIEDQVPIGAILGDDTGIAGGAIDPWQWVSQNPVPQFGRLAHQSAVIPGLHQHFFYYDVTIKTMHVTSGDNLFAYVYLDPNNPPREVMLQWYELGGSDWQHRAYWGENLIVWGAEGTAGHHFMGPLPLTGQWMRLEVPARLVGLEDCDVNGMAFTLWDGRATWDRAGKSPQQAVAIVSPNSAEKRLVGRVSTVYRKNDLSGPLPVGQIESLALPWETYKMAFTPGLLNIYSAKASAATLAQILSTQGSYQNLDKDGVWWVPSGHVFYSNDPAGPDPAFAGAHFYLPQGAIDPFGNVSNVTYDQPYNLLIAQSQDALQNIVTAQNDYRVLQPSLITDPNLNRSAVRFDALGMVIATAVMGKDGANEGDTLDDPTTKFEYDLFNWEQNSEPNLVHAFAREMHGSANPRWQESYSYSDGLGREVMRKIQAEPGLAPVRDANGKLVRDSNGKLVPPQFTQSRWVGTGRTVFDNKGNPVKKYEPFFDSTPAYENESDLVELGVTPILRYDPPGRLIRTDNPDGSYSKVVFTPWQQAIWDQNDTVLDSAWYAKRGSPPPSSPEPTEPEVRAAWLTTKHANTATIRMCDTLGRTFLTIADNGPDSTPRMYETRVKMDIQGNQRSVTDALNRQVMTYDYDMLNTRVHHFSVDAGERWMLNDVSGKLIRGWDSRDTALRHTYDALRRPSELFVKTGNGAELLVERILYGEGQSNEKQLNLRGKVFQQFDGAGILTNNQYDFKGNLLNSTRQFLQKYKDPVNWSEVSMPALENETFMSTTTYDALNRAIQLVAPKSNARSAKFNIIQPVYNEANLLEKIDNWIGQSTAPEALLDPSTANFHPVTNLDYNAKGQRELVQYGNGARTSYIYDPDTFRLIHLTTTRAADNAALQELAYSYDPVGNITQIKDTALQTIYYNNQVVDPGAAYVYDPIYRLTKANGREHIGQVTQPQPTWDDSPRINRPLPSDGQAMRNYVERYQYDSVGNILTLAHTATDGNWTRTYAYDEPNAVPTNNRLTSTTVGTVRDPYAYDAHGNMTQMPHLPVMQWNFKDQLQITQQQVVNNGQGERTYYVYDAAGQRVRKITERTNGTKKQERMYVGGFEVYREYDGSGGTTILERDSLHVMDDKRRVALVETKVGGTDVTVTRYQFDNHLGSAVLELDENAAIISYEEYYSYGSTSYQAVSTAIEVGSKRYRYTGKERDDETGFYYHRARYYAPWLAKWTSCDPIGMVDGSNIYHYARNNPIRWVDSKGTEADDPPTSSVQTPQLKPFDERKYAASDRNRPNPRQKQAKENFESLSPQQRITTGRATAPLKQAAAREEVRLATPWDEQVVFDISQHTGGNDIARALTGASEWNEAYSTEERVLLGAKGLVAAYSLAAPAAKLTTVAAREVLSNSSAAMMDAAVAAEEATPKLAPGLGSGRSAEDLAVHFREQEMMKRGLTLRDTQFANNNGIDALYASEASPIQVADEIKFVSKLNEKSLVDLVPKILNDTKYGTQATEEYVRAQGWRLLRSSVATTTMQESGTLIATSRVEAHLVLVDEYANVHVIDGSWVEILLMR